MCLPSQRSSSTLSTGTLAAARDSPPLRRRLASSRPRRCGIETTSGTDIQTPFLVAELHLILLSQKTESKGRGRGPVRISYRLRFRQRQRGLIWISGDQTAVNRDFRLLSRNL